MKRWAEPTLRGRCLHRLRCRLDRFDNIDIARATAKVPRDGPADLELARAWIRLEQRDAGEHHPGGTEAALEAVLIPERLLDRVKGAVLFEAFDGADLAAVDLDGEDGTGLDRQVIQDDGTGAAATSVAANVGAGQAERLA